MKRVDLVRLLQKNGWSYLRSGGEHDIFAKGEDRIAIPRHSEIKEGLAKSIIRKKGLK